MIYITFIDLISWVFCVFENKFFVGNKKFFRRIYANFIPATNLKKSDRLVHNTKIPFHLERLIINWIHHFLAILTTSLYWQKHIEFFYTVSCWKEWFFYKVLIFSEIVSEGNRNCEQVGFYLVAWITSRLSTLAWINCKTGDKTFFSNFTAVCAANLSQISDIFVQGCPFLGFRNAMKEWW